MKLLNQLSIKQIILPASFGVLLVYFLFSSVAVFNFSRNRTIETTNQQMMVYLDNLADIISIVDGQTEKGLNNTDLSVLKPIFSNNAFFTSDFPYLIDNSGTFILHQYKEKQKAPREIIQRINSSILPEGHFELATEKQGKWVQNWVYFKRLPAQNVTLAISVDSQEALSHLQSNRSLLIVIVLAGALVFFIVILLVLNPIVKAIGNVEKTVKLLAQGELPEHTKSSLGNEMNRMGRSINMLIDGLRATSQFATDIGNNNLETDFAPLGPNDVLGNALIEARNKLKTTALEDEKRKVKDKQNNWVNMGVAKFSDILRHNSNNLQQLADTVLQNLVDYLNANQGGLFTLNDEDQENIHLELISAFAFNRKKFKQKTFLLGEGLVGNCAIEKQTIHLREIPENYIEITSGLGDASPRSLIIVPLKIENNIFGVIEIASFNLFQDHEVQFIEKVSESIATTLSSVRSNIKTGLLLEQSQQQREEMAAQEEEMRQNMEEMLATQEEMARKSTEVEGITAAINESLIFTELNEQGLLSEASPNFLQTTEYGKIELENKSLFDLIHPEDLISFQKAWGEVVESKPFKGSLRIITRTGKDVFILVNIIAAFDEKGDIFKIYFLGQDITESKKLEAISQKQAEEIEQALIEAQMEQSFAQEREAEMSTLLEALNQVCLVTLINTDKTISYINDKNVDVLGDDKETIEGKNHAEIDQQARENPSQYDAMWEALLSGEAQRREFSLDVKGKKIWIKENYIPVHDEAGNISRIINIGIDITQFKDTEQQLIAQLEAMQKGKK